MKVFVLSKREALKSLSETITVRDLCYYLGDDYLSLAKIRGKIGPRGDIQTLGHRFHKVVGEIEGEFLRFCHEINFKNQSDAFWGTHLGSRNSASTPLLKTVVYFICARHFLEQHCERLIFICDRFALAKMIAKDAGEKGYSCVVSFSPNKCMSFLGIYAKLLRKSLVFLVFSTVKWFYLRLCRNVRIGKEDIMERYVFRSWITKGNTDGVPGYRDRNFGVLPDYLQECGKDVWIIPLFFNLGINVFSEIKSMVCSGKQFLFNEQYVSLLDIWKTLFDGLKGLSLNLDGCQLRGRNLSSIVHEIHLAHALSPTLLSYNLDKYLLKKLKKRGVAIDKFVYPIESNPVEKKFIIAIRAYYPASKIIAFQHSVWFKEQLGMFLCPEELDYHPLPDQIICSGQRYLEVLSQSGFPGNLLHSGPNLRYTMVNNFRGADTAVRKTDGRKVLVLLNFNMNHALEMLEKFSRALQKMGPLEIYIKPHPLLSIKQLSLFLESVAFPKYEWVKGSVQEWVTRTNVVVMTGGSVSNLETIAMGAPLLRISLENDFDFDTLWDEYPFLPFVNTPDEIRDALIAALHLPESKRDELIKFGHRVIERYFEPVTQERLGVFL